MDKAKAVVAVVTLILAACAPYPRDVEGTTDQIRRQGIVRVAFAELDPRQAAIARNYAERVAAEVGAQVGQQPNGTTESVFARLEEGELDLVIAEVAADSPWLTDVAVLEPLSRRRAGQRLLTLSPVARNGENRWIGLLEVEARDMAAGQ